MTVMNVEKEKQILLSELHKLSKPARDAVKKILISFDLAIFELKHNPLVSEAILPGEEWRDIEGYEGIYQISNLGRIKSFKYGRIRILKGNPNGNGYSEVTLHKNGTRNIVMAHILVARAFIPNPEQKPQVNHIDGNKQNNRVDNLEWVTSGENLRHAYAMGLVPKIMDSKHFEAKLTEEQVRWIRANHIPRDRIFGTNALAQKFGVAKTTIWSIVNYKRYKNVK